MEKEQLEAVMQKGLGMKVMVRLARPLLRVCSVQHCTCIDVELKSTKVSPYGKESMSIKHQLHSPA